MGRKLLLTLSGDPRRAPEKQTMATVTASHKMLSPCKYFRALSIGGVPTTPDPHTSAKASRYKWEAYRDTNWSCICYFVPRGRRYFCQNIAIKMGGVSRYFSKSIGIRGRLDSPHSRRHCKEGLPGPRTGFWVPSGSLPPKTATN